MESYVIYRILFIVIIFVYMIIKIMRQSNELEKLREEKQRFASINHEKELMQKENMNTVIKDKDRMLQIYKEKEQKHQEDIIASLKDNEDLQKEINSLSDTLKIHQNSLEDFLKSNVTSIPFLAGMIADYLTYDFEILCKKLDWGTSQERQKKIQSIREIRKDAKERIEQAKIAIYQLEYLKTLYPVLEEVLETDYRDLTFKNEIPEYDPIRNYLSKEEWSSLPGSERNQIALDNYTKSRNKTSWQIGRDYELYIGYKYTQSGYDVDYYGSYMGLEDLGRDLIAKNDFETLIIQCKYWSQHKTIHEKHINQLYGTLVSYSIEHNQKLDYVRGIFVTNIDLSEKAKQFAKYLNIEVIRNYSIGEFPSIKCNMGIDEDGYATKIYHLPMDQQYDKVKMTETKSCFAMTVKEAENLGYRRAYRWHGLS